MSKHVFILMATMTVSMACGETVQQPAPAERAAPGGASGETRTYLLERVDDAAVVQLYADGFASLPLKEKILIWHLYQAALAGRDIFYDQRYAHNLAMRDILEEIITHPARIDPADLREIQRYTKLFWINTGPYNNLTARKFVLQMRPEAFLTAMKTAAQNGASFRARKPGESVEALFERYKPMFFDASFDPIVTNKTPPAGRDILESSANNLYVGVSMSELKGFTEKYPLNSRLVDAGGGRLVEEVYRLGGRYSEQIAAIVKHLEAAIPYATEPMARALRALIRFYRTGETADRKAYDIAWVQDKDSPVDTINGFIEVYMDARGMKGAWEGLVFYVNREKTHGIEALAREAQWFEDRMPWDPKYRKAGVTGITARAIDVVVETGDSGPVTPIGINLPNDQEIREKYGSKSVSLSNVIEAYEKSTPPEFRREFSWTPEEAARADRWSAAAGELTTNMHEVIGHASGRVSEHLKGNPQAALKEQFSALEEARADLVALYFLPDPKLAELGLVPKEHQEEIVLAEYEAYTRNALVQLRRVREGSELEEDHMRNRQMIVRWLMANTKAIEVRQRDGKTYYVMVEAAAFREGVGRLLAEVQRIKGEGDYPAARKLFETYGIHFDPKLRDEVVARVKTLNLPSYTGFVMPKLEPIPGPDGAITDVKISYPMDLTTQMLEYSRMPQPPPGLHAIVAAEDARAEGAALRPILDGLKHPDPAIQRVAVRALGRLERAEHAATIARLLSAPDPQVRAEAANALAQVTSSDPGFAADALAARLIAEQDEGVIGAIAAALGRLPYSVSDEFRDAEQTLAALLQDSPAPAVRLGAVRGLDSLYRRLGRLVRQSRSSGTTALAADASAVDRLRRLSEPGEAVVQRLALSGLMSVAAVDGATARRAMADADAEVRRLAALAAGQTDQPLTAADRRELLTAAMQDRDRRVRYEGLVGYGRQLAAAGCGPVLQALADLDQHVSLAAIDILGRGACPERDAVVARLAALADGLPSIRGRADWHHPAHAIVALAGIDPGRARLLVAGFARHPVWQVRMYAARAAGTLGDAGLLRRLAVDEDDNVRAAAIRALVTVAGHGADDLYLAALQSGDELLLMTAAEALAGTPERDRAVPALLEALARKTKDRKDTSRDARLAILTRLKELGSNARAGALEVYLSDFDPRVAAVAAETLTIWRGTPRQPVTTRLGLLDPPAAAELEALPRRARVVMRGIGTFELTLLPDEAPVTVWRFATLARSGYYNGLTFHRVVPNFVIQGGSPGANEYAGHARYMRDEVGRTSHTRGTVGISTRGRDTGDAQIFINLSDNPRLDHVYTVFAEVSRGMDVVDRILEGAVIERIVAE